VELDRWGLIGTCVIEFCNQSVIQSVGHSVSQSVCQKKIKAKTNILNEWF